MMRLLILFTITSCSIAFSSHAKSSYLSLDEMKIQFAGNIGFFSIGVSKRFFQNKLDSSLFYGHVPERIGGRALNSLAVKNSYHFFDLFNRNHHYASTYFGFSLIYTEEVSVNTLKMNLEGQEQPPANSINVMPYFGLLLSTAKLNDKKLPRSSIYVEVGMLGVLIESYLINHNGLESDITDYANIAVGISQSF